jgi:hypothetical protein
LSRWFRMYSDVLDDPKVQKLPPELFKAWVNLLCLAGRNDRVLPCVDDIAFALRMSQDVTRDMVRDLSQRGLLDDGEDLMPHNWNERQFKSDKDETAAERKRAQRMREKKGDVTDDVTRDTHVTSRPPEQSRTDTEQSRAEAPAHTEGEELSKEVQGYLDSRTDDMTAWEVRFLISIKWSNSLSKAQRETLKGIREKLAPRDGAKPLPSVKKGTPQFDAWIAYYRRTGRPTAFYEKQDAITVFSEYPPQEQAA